MATQVASIKWMPSTSDRRFIVDGFNFQTPSCRTYFLTHYHSDHTTGLSRGFSSGTIYTSEVTARLLIHDMGIKPNVIRALPMHTPIMIEGCRVTLLNANHCPGAVMLLVEVVEGGPRKVLLHTGDCRWAEGMADQIPAGVRVDEIFLDTTYCMPRHSFPPQQHVIQSLVREVQLLGQPLNPSGNQSNAITQPPACQNSAPNQSMVDRTLTDHSSTCTIHSPSADPTAAALLGWAEGAHLGQQQLQPQHPKLLVGQAEQQLEQMEQQEQQQHHPHHYQQNHHQQQHKDEAHCKDLDASPSLGSNASVQTACFLSNKTPHAGPGSGANSAPFNQSSPHARSLPMHTSPIHDSGGTFGDGKPATTPAGARYGVQEKEALQSAGTADPNLAAAEQGRPQPARTSGCSSSSSSSGAVGSMAGCTPETHGLAANLAKSSSFTAGHASGTPAISADTLVVVAAYRIGKERVFLGLARALGVKVWCSPAKRRVLAQLGLSDPDWALLTDDPFQAQLHVVSWGMKPEALHRKYLGTPPGTLPPRRSQLSQSAQQNAPTAAPAALEDQAQKDGPHLLAPGVRREGETAGTHLEECHGSPALGLGSAGGNKSGRTCQSKEGLGEDEAEEFEEDEGCGAWEGRDEEDEEEEGGVPLHSAADTVKGDFCGSSITANTSNSSNIKVEGGTGVAAAGGAAYEGGGPELRSRAHWRRVIGIRPTGWSFRPRARSLFSHWSLGAVTVISAPYSEHSSFTELCACVKALRPTKIIPTVNAATPAEARTIINRFAPLMDLSRDRSRLDMYLLPQPSPAARAQQHRQHGDTPNGAQAGDVEQHGPEAGRRGTHPHLHQSRQRNAVASSAHSDQMQQCTQNEVDCSGAHPHSQQRKQPEDMQGQCPDEQATQDVLSRIDLGEQQRIWDQLQAARALGLGPSSNTSKPLDAGGAAQQLQRIGQRQSTEKQQKPCRPTAVPSQASSSRAAKQHSSEAKPSSNQAAKQHRSEAKTSGSPGCSTPGTQQVPQQRGQHLSQKQQPHPAPPSSSSSSSPSWQGGKGGKGQKRHGGALPQPVGGGAGGNGKKQRSLHAFFGSSFAAAPSAAPGGNTEQLPVASEESRCEEAMIDVICID